MASEWRQLVLPDNFAQALSGGDVLKEIINRAGETVREAPGRRTFRFHLNGRSFFAKVHFGVGWGEIVKNVSRLRRPAISAIDEWRAIHRVQELGIHTTPPVAFGLRGRNPARIESFLVTEDLGETVTLEAYCRDNDLRELPWSVRRRLIEQLAHIARTLHANGINHRDMYLCHFRTRLDESGYPTGPLHLMDLHRAQIRRRTSLRLRMKDIGGLYFSAMNVGWTRQDFFRFVVAYTGRPLPAALRKQRIFWWLVADRAKRLYQRKGGPGR